MADQVIPIQDIASLGVIKDIPNISLPPNAYSDVQNIRFHDGAAWKMEGEEDLILPALVGETVVYAAYWRGPINQYYIVITDNQTTQAVYVHTIKADGTLNNGIKQTNMNFDITGTWQHTLFNGGFNIILNNGVDVPYYLTDEETIGSSNIAPLPNWDSYLSQEDVTSVAWDTFNTDIELGRGIDYTTDTILYTVIPRDTSIGIINAKVEEADEVDTAPFSVDTADPDNAIITPAGRSDTQEGALPGDQIIISIQNKANITVRAGVVRAYGNLLVAGDLTETSTGANTPVIRRLPGTIRTSDVAAPGAVPLNWNPFRVGANTADEFILSSTGIVQDMAELQGVLYIYTDVSIHGIQQTGNPTIPFQISTVTDSYGCNSLGAVMEFDGRHLVVGSQDIYVFAGHPGSIASIGDKKVRHYAYERAELDINNVRMVRNQKYDEIWIFTPKIGTLTDPLDEMLVWNYRSQAWTIRKQSDVLSGTQGPSNPLFANASSVFIGDAVDKYTLYTYIPDPNVDPMETDKYNSYVERMRLGLTPEFDTETLGATAMMYTSPTSVDLTVTMRGSNYPSDNTGIVGAKTFTFFGANDYKVDTRIQGRFINYKISDNSATADWNITGYQLEIMKGGKR